MFSSRRFSVTLRSSLGFPHRVLSSSSSSSSMGEHSHLTETDVLVVGGGVAGAAMVKLLRERTPSLEVGLVEASSGPSKALSEWPHPRSYALSPTSLELLGLDATHPRLGNYDSMQVWENKQPASLIFTAKDANKDHLGAVVEDVVLVQHLWERLEGCQRYTDTTVSNISLPEHASRGLVDVQLESKDGIKQIHRTKLLVGADGANSSVRQQIAISTKGFSYDQSALTFTVQLAASHRKRAFQRFLPSGPLALLPTFSDKHAIVVWSTTREQVELWKEDPDIASHINQLLQDGPELLDPLWEDTSRHLPTPFANILSGAEALMRVAQYGPSMAAQEFIDPFLAPPIVESVVSPQFAFPLQCRQVTRYTDPRLALIGDAAHSMHPLAGQGLNLGLQDVANLVDIVEKAYNAGMDVATFLGEYETDRRIQVSTTLSGIHAIQRIFGEQSGLAKHVKSFGMNAIQNIGLLRRQLVDVACQGVSYSPTTR